MADPDLQLGGADDTVHIRFGGPNGGEVHQAQSYDIQMSILRQPAAFTVRIGHGGIAAALLSRYPKGTPFEILVGGSKDKVVIQSGVTYSIGVPTAAYTQVEVAGRDWMARVFDSMVEEAQSFSEKTFYALTRKVLDTVGLKEDPANQRFGLLATNKNNRQLISSTTINARQDAEAEVRTLETGTTAGPGQTVLQAVKAKVGTRYYDLLTHQYKLAGLFLWASGEGNFVLSRPNVDQEPAYAIYRSRGASRSLTNVLDASFRDDATNRSAQAIVYGRGGGRKAGRAKYTGKFVDEEMTAAGFTNSFVEYDKDVKTVKQAEYLARRRIAEQRRAGWSLSYTLAGHRVPSRFAKNSFAVWAPDTMVQVDDDDLGIHGRFYIESVAFRRGPQTTTTVTLMRPGDLLFAEGLQ